MDKKVRVCVVTWGCSMNYGTALQAFALEYKLRQMGWEASFLSCPARFTWRGTIRGFLEHYRLLSIWRRLRCLIGGGAHPIRCSSRRQSKLEKWFDSVHNVSRVAYAGDMRRLLRRTDCFLCGSDQIWNTYVGYNPIMYLEFAKGCRRASYSTSIGTAGINPAYAKRVKAALSRFQAISVREMRSVETLNQLLNRKDVVHVLDPTFLLDSNDWSNIIPANGDPMLHEEPYVLCYLIGKSRENAERVRDVSRKIGIDRIVIVSSMENPDVRVEGALTISDADPFEFVRLIKDAALVCTDSYHATAFSINFRRPFVELMRFSDGDESSQNMRIYDLLERFGLKNRIAREGVDFNPSECDFTVVDRRLNGLRAESLAYLKHAVSM